MEDSERETEVTAPQSARLEYERTPETTALQAVLREIQQLREEQACKQAELAAAIQRQDAEIRTLRESLRGTTATNTQISPLALLENTNLCHAAGGDRSVFLRESCDVRTPSREEIGYKLKPDTYDGSVPLREFFSQFSLIARANGWSEETKTAVLVSSLRGKARAILENVENLETLDFAELKSKLELRFGESQSAQSYYSQFTNRRQRFNENLATLGADIERLSQLAYPECAHPIRDKIACAQFVSALSDNFVKRTLQLEGVTSLKIAVERAKAVKSIHENSFGQKGRYFNEEKKEQIEGSKGKKERGSDSGNLYKTKGVTNNSRKKECWECGKEGHFRFECPGRAETGNRE